MVKNEFLEIFGNLSELNKIEAVSPEAAEKLFGLMNCLSRANKIHNLTAIKDDKGVVLKHFIDSLMISSYVPAGAKAIDVGCGAGFPSLPLAICRPDVTVLGIDSTAKKINYVNETARTLELDNIEAISVRAEELERDFSFIRP